MVLGNSKAWKRRFVTVDVRLLQRISVLWPRCLTVLKDQDQPHEDTITIQLVDVLWKDEVIRSLCHWVEYQFEPFGVHPSGAKYSKGKIDMAVILDQERERYIAYECKRLNVRYDGDRKSLAGKYIKEGVMRFITEKYADGLPVGCMLGYVMDGDVIFAAKQVRMAILDNKGILGLISGPIATTPVNSIKRFLTNHKRPTTGTTIEIRHAFLAFPAT